MTRRTFHMFFEACDKSDLKIFRMRDDRAVTKHTHIIHEVVNNYTIKWIRRALEILKASATPSKSNQLQNINTVR